MEYFDINVMVLLLKGGVGKFGETSSSTPEFENTQPEKILPTPPLSKGYFFLLVLAEKRNKISDKDVKMDAYQFQCTQKFSKQFT